MSADLEHIGGGEVNVAPVQVEATSVTQKVVETKSATLTEERSQEADGIATKLEEGGGGGAKPASKMNAKAAAFVPSFGAAAFVPGGAVDGNAAMAQQPQSFVSTIPGMPGFPMPFIPSGMGVGGLMVNPQHQPVHQQHQHQQRTEKKEILEAPVKAPRLKMLENELKAQGLSKGDIDEHLQSVFCFLHQENMLTVSSFQTIDYLLPGVAHNENKNAASKDPASTMTLCPFWADLTVGDFHGIAEAILTVEECRAEADSERNKKKYPQGKPPKSLNNNVAAAADDDEGSGDENSDDVDPKQWIGVVGDREPTIPVPFLEAYCNSILPTMLKANKEERVAHDILVEEMYAHRHQRLQGANQRLGDEVAQAPAAGNNLKSATANSAIPHLYMNETTRQEVSEAVGFMLMLYYTALRVSMLPSDTTQEKFRIESLRERLYSCPGSRSFVRWVLPLMVACELAESGILKCKARAEMAPPTTAVPDALNVAAKVCDLKLTFAKVMPKVCMAFISIPPRCSAGKFSAHLGKAFQNYRSVVDATLGDIVYGYPRWKEQLFSESTSTVLYLASRPASRVPAVAPPKVQAVLGMDTKVKAARTKPSTLGLASQNLQRGLEALAGGSTNKRIVFNNGADPSTSVKIGLSTHKARPLAETEFMADIKVQIRQGLVTRESALAFALTAIAESDELATHTLSKAFSALETVVLEGIWTPLEDICNLPPPAGVADFFDVAHTYLMPRDHIHKRLVRQTSRVVADRVRQSSKNLAAPISIPAPTAGGGTITGSLLPLGMNVGVWGASEGGSTW